MAARLLSRARRFVALTLLAVIVSAGLAAASDEGELLSRIKSAAFDRDWPLVLADADRFIASFPHSPSLPRAYYYRAQALESLERGAQFETQEELKNECVVALLSFRIEVFNQLRKKVIVIVNVPIAFAELALESLRTTATSSRRSFPISRNCSKQSRPAVPRPSSRSTARTISSKSGSSEAAMSRRSRLRPPEVACGRELPAPQSPRARRFVALTLLAVIVSAGLAAASDECELLRRIKSDAFDDLWPQVLTASDQFIASYPRSQAQPYAYYFRAQALQSVKRYDEAILRAYDEFLRSEAIREDALLKRITEDALLKRITMARIQYGNRVRRHIGIILEGMDQEEPIRIHAAIEASRIDHRRATRKGIPILKDCARFETKEGVKAGCAAALLRLDPKQAQEGPPLNGESKCKLIKMEVFDKIQLKTTVTSLPLTFFGCSPLQYIPPEYYGEVTEERAALDSHDIRALELQMRALDLLDLVDCTSLHDAIRLGICPQTLADFDGEEESIRLGIECALESNAMRALDLLDLVDCSSLRDVIRLGICPQTLAELDGEEASIRLWIE